MSVRCRTCGELIYNLNAENIFEPQNEGILHKIEALTGIWLSYELDMPEHICACCLLDLNHAISFRKRCIKTNELLFSRTLKEIADCNNKPTAAFASLEQQLDPLNNLDINDTDWADSEEDNAVIDDLNEVENSTEVYIKPETSSCSIERSTISQDRPVTAIVIPPPIERLAPPRIIRPAQKLTLPRANNTLRVKDMLVQRSGSTRVTQKTQLRTTTQRTPEKQQTSQCDGNRTTTTILINKSKPRKKRVRWRLLNETETMEMKRKMRCKNLVCDQCGRNFNDAGNFKLHLLRHTGVKQFQCPECDYKDWTTHLLNLHIRVRHRGEMPYACKYCDERFASSTTRVRHERKIHTHVKPNLKTYDCQHCGKSFNSKSGWKIHDRVHTGERPFRCETCDVAFQRNTNLTTHYRSKAHQKRASQALEGRDAAQVATDDEIDFDFNDSIIEEIDE